MLSAVDGVLFSGGSDVDPLRFGQQTTGKMGGVVPEREPQFSLFYYNAVLKYRIDG